MPSLGTTFGRGGATLPEWELANADCIVIQGSDMAESHPVAFRFVMQAKQRGATVIHVDPVFRRTGAMVDLHVPIRPGSDIAFVGALINHVLTSERWNTDPFFREWILNYTNAASLVSEAFEDTEDLDGLFSGFRREDGGYDFSTWQYEGQPVPAPTYNPVGLTTESFSEEVGRLTEQPVPRDDTLQHPRCVLQILRRHYGRYTPEMVERVCGVSRDDFERVARTLLDNAGRDRTGAWCYAVGWTQHTVGVQMIRAAAILQLLLGNVGRPGSGILPLRGHATIQGSTDIPTLYDMLPGYLGQPHTQKNHETLDAYIDTEYAPTGWWAHLPAYIVSLLKAWYGDAAREETGYAYDHLPRISGDHSQLPMTLAIDEGRIRGLFVMGQNPAVGGNNARLVRRAFARLDWLVVRDAFETETASFWYASPEVHRGELRPSAIGTEVFLLPAALASEKAGSFTNTHRLVQWHDKAVDPPGDARSEPWFVHELRRRLHELYAADAEPDSMRVRQLRDLTWAYPLQGRHQEPDVEAVLREINGYRVADGAHVASFTELKDDGSTACGCWLYSGVMPAPDRNLARNRQPDAPDGPGTHLDWGFAWPANRRMLYNRASADPAGRPWSARKRYMAWDAHAGRWTGPDVPDFPERKAPEYEPDRRGPAKGLDAHTGRAPFIMMADGLGWLFVPSGLKDGPLPTHYEPVESPVRNALYRQQINPAAKLWERADNRYHQVGDPRFPHVLTTYRLTEHHTGGLMTRAVPWLSELHAEGFVELGPELAAEIGVDSGGWATVATERGAIEARAVVTSRLRPLRVDGRLVHVVGMPWHFGYRGIAQGGIANDLSAIVADPNVSIHEGKAFTCAVRRGRKEGP